MTTDYSAIHQAVALLAGVCDFANSDDSQGFNGQDAYLGHALADMGVAAWDAEMAYAAHAMLHKYRNTQLEPTWGIKYDELPVPQVEGLVITDRSASRTQAARDHTRGKIAENRERKYRAANDFVICDGEGEEVILGFTFNWDLVTEAKTIAGRRYKELYRGHKKVNIYPFSSLPLVIAFADKHEIPVTPEVRVLADIAKAKHAGALKAAEEAAAARALLPHVRLGDRGGLVLVKDWDSDTERLNDALYKLNRDHSTWDRAANLHRLPHRDPEALKKVIAEYGLTVSPEAQTRIDGELDRQELNLAKSKAATAEPMPVRGLAEWVTIMPQQWPVVRWALEFRQCWIGDDMGLGKSLSALAAIAIDDAYPLVIVCMPSLVENWMNELKRFPRLTIFVAEGQKPQPIPVGTDVVIIGSAVLGFTPRTGSERGTFPWVRAISAIQPKALILDEGQIAKEQTANRTKAIKELAAPIVEANGMKLNLTGTAMMNRPKELASQLEIMGRIDAFGGTGAYLMRHCAGERSQFGTKFDQAHHLDEIYRTLRTEGIMIRRNKSILGLPELREHELFVDTVELDQKFMAEYYAAERDVVKFLGDKAAKIAKRFGVDPADARVRAAMKASNAEHLVMINTLRGLIGKAKIEYAKRWVQAQVDSGEKVVVSGHHKEVTEALYKTFGGLKIVGGQTTKSKEADKAKFQNEPTAMVITLAVEAGGTGHTLTAARRGLMTELTWTPGAKNQLRDRQHRIGQKREVDFYILIAQGTVDETLYTVLTEKQARLDAVLDGKSADGVDADEDSLAGEVAWQLAMKGVQVGARA